MRIPLREPAAFGEPDPAGDRQRAVVRRFHPGFDAGELPFASELRAAAQSPSLYSMAFGEQSPFLVAFFPVLTSPLVCSLDSLTSAENAVSRSAP